MKRKKLSCIALLLLLFFAFGIVAESASVVAAPIIGRWQFDEGIGSITLDSSGKEKTGTISASSWVEGIINKALKFSGAGSHVQVPSSNLMSLPRWSLTAFVMPTGTNALCVYSEKDSAGKPTLKIIITTDNRIRVEKANGALIGETAANVITRNEWNNIVVAYENGTVNCYVSGTTTQIVVRRVSLNKTQLLLVPGETETLVETIFPANATNQNVTWSSSNTSVATVNQKGVVTGKGPGEAIITVRTEDGGYTATCKVTVGIPGASWTVGSSTDLTRLDWAAGKSAGADFSNIYPWSKITQVTQNGRTMIKIPKFYYKRTYNSSSKKHEMWVVAGPYSDFKVHPAFVRSGKEKPYILVGADKFGAGQTIAQCRSTAQGYGTGWGIMDIQTWSAIQMLQLIEYANTSGSTNYRGINGLYSEAGQYVDGLISKNGAVWIGNNNTSFILPSGAGYIKDWHYSTAYDWLFLPKGDVSASANTHIASTFRRTTAETVAVGGCSWWHCDCSTYCKSCYNNQHGYCQSGCRCRCNCYFHSSSGRDWGCRYGDHDGCRYYGDGFCGRPPGSSLGLFSWACRLSATTASPTIGARLQYIP